MRSSPAVAGAEIAETSSADAIISQGVALSGADALQNAGASGAGVTIAVLDQAFGAASRLDALAGTELPPIDRQHRLTFDQTYGLAGPRLQRQQLAPRRVRERDRLRHGAFARPTGSSTTTRPTSSARRPTTSPTCSSRDIVVHSNSFLFGPFDGSGWFARKVDAAAAAGILWVNSAGNYRTRHWEGAWSDADARRQPRRPRRRQRLPLRARGDQSRPPATSRGRARRAIPAATTASRSTATRR